MLCTQLCCTKMLCTKLWCTKRLCTKNRCAPKCCALKIAVHKNAVHQTMYGAPKCRATYPTWQLCTVWCKNQVHLTFLLTSFSLSHLNMNWLNVCNLLSVSVIAPTPQLSAIWHTTTVSTVHMYTTTAVVLGPQSVHLFNQALSVKAAFQQWSTTVVLSD